MSEISGIRHPPDIRPDPRYPVFRMAGYPAKLLCGPSLNLLWISTKVRRKLVLFFEIHREDSLKTGGRGGVFLCSLHYVHI